MLKVVSGFSKMSKLEKIDYLSHFLGNPEEIKERIKSFWHLNVGQQKVFDEFSENTLTNFYFPYGVVPNILINDKIFCVPMVIEESSVVAAAANAANYWRIRGGIKSEIISTEKVGQVHFSWIGESEKLFNFFAEIKNDLIDRAGPLLYRMKKRGGGLVDLTLKKTGPEDPNLFQLFGVFETCDAMGANFINTVLEFLGKELKALAKNHHEFFEDEKDIEIIMAILSNYTPNCRVKTYVECPVKDLSDEKLGMSGFEFAAKFKRAIKISHMDIYRATTHNKGIFNGIDAVILATGNDFRATEACAHAYAARSGKYRGLTEVSIDEGIFRLTLEIPLSLGTVGGLTSLHPMAQTSLELLGNPKAFELMMIASSLGLLQNFAAIKSLVTSGIQKGHMKMHLLNILNRLGATDVEQEKVKEHFKNKIISFNDVQEFIKGIRTYQ